MDRAIPTVIIVVVVLGLLALMWRSWRARRRRDSALVAGYPMPGATGVATGAATTDAAPLASVPVFYVATTPRENAIERLAIRGLGFRARGELSVSPSGVVVSLAGEDDVFVPPGAIDRLEPATWAIDRAVETGGLLRLGWTLASGEAVDSYFRVTDPQDRVRVTDALRTIAPGAVGPAVRDESEA